MATPTTVTRPSAATAEVGGIPVQVEQKPTLHPLLANLPEGCKEVALIYNPAREAHIGSASVDNAPPVRVFTISCCRRVPIEVIGEGGKIETREQLTLPSRDLLVGVNLGVDVSFLNDCLHQNPAVRLRFQQGAITIRAPKMGTESIADLQAFTEETANDLILNNWNQAQLESWLTMEVRPQVRGQIGARIKALKEGEAQ